ncbi:uncharacterized protein LOC130052531 [Ostrea edulis]|uniref:uncharacterized protein LOC130052531 n=1 Tax=Ostrea edulis TaxID=37623 RepID=UPI0024AEC3D7|nr:uncharacterized protein LOC130052531 [Ostrea edulis]XP_056013675.1 uncharacterized protein LOC130052531 [Ostrea edulis]
MDHIPRVSDVLYVGVCRKIGTPTEVTFRRDMRDTEDMIRKPSELYEGRRTMLSGSYREGFRFKSSDMDYMVWYSDHKVICEMSQSTFYHPPRDTLIYMETSDTPPGFAKLQLLTPSNYRIVMSSLLERNHTEYISSSLLRMRFHQSRNGSNPANEGENLHGPCHNYTYRSIETDIALCFHSRHWPLPALPWVDRCLTRAWPSRSVLQSIIDEGCHLVPIANRQTNENSDLEWRISFSQAEQKLVYSMNHCQFLCYGIMKIILKEVISDELLCSYFMKTILFWRIQERSSTPWLPSTLIQHVWFCFKSLMQCVYTGYLPNFFIPENNMFAGKVVGAQQISLYQKLERFYKMGVAFLLHSPTLREILIPAVSNPYFVMQTGESYLKSEIYIDIASYCENASSRGMVYASSDFLSNMMHLNVIDQLFSTCQNVIYHDRLINVLVSTSMSLKAQCLFVSKKKRYTIERSMIHMLGLVSKLGCVSDGLYLALYLYDTGRYQTALTVTDTVKQRLSQPHIMYHDRVDIQRYSEVVGGQSLLTKYRKAWARNIVFFKDFTFTIEELRLEQEVSNMNGMPNLHLPPFVTVYMLSVLCHYRLGDRSQYIQALTDLHTLLLYDDGSYVPLLNRDLAWQILGICQHVVGDLHGALQSYQESLRQEPKNKIQIATGTRIDLVKSQLRVHSTSIIT